MSRKLNMYWYKMPGEQENFGDVLGPFLVKILSGNQIRFVPVNGVKWKPVLYRLFEVLKGNKQLLSTLKFMINVLRNINRENIIVSVGSIISVYNRKSILVWGAGLMNRNDIIHKASFFAVRGKYTQQRLKELGYDVPNVVGDPALLLPLFIDPSPKKYRLGIIPHYIHYEELKKHNLSDDILVINLLDDIQSVTKNITSCSNTISSSLHGLIVSHAYHVPSLWVNFSENKLVGDGVKFKDYFSSVEIEYYQPFQVEVNRVDVDKTIELIQENNSVSIIQNSLKFLQNELIRVAPFPVLDKYKKV